MSNRYVDIYNEAVEASRLALAAKPDHNMFEWAWVNVQCKGEGLRFINALKKANLVEGSDQFRRDKRRGGYTWVFGSNQGSRSPNAARSVSEILEANNVPCYWLDALD